MDIHRTARSLVRGLAVLVMVLGAAPARADSPAPLSLTAVRSWSAPAGTRIVLDFSQTVQPVMPDSGSGARLVISVPEAGIVPGADVPSVLAVGDSAVDSVYTAFDASGVRFTIVFAPGASFRAFTLPPVDGKPFRIAVDVVRRDAQVEQARRLAEIAAAKKRDRVRIVFVDAGHGGEDTGARGTGGVLEKNVTLAVAKNLAGELNKIPGVRALLTRDSDFFIPLHQRYKIAEQARADLFISIHCNSSRRRGSGSGTEVYFLSLKGASDQADEDLADVENAADLVGGVPSQAEDDVVGVLYNVKRNAALEHSQLLAETLLDHVAANRRVESRGIKQAGFAVLKSVEFPSVLVETAFINNPREVRLLRDPVFQHELGRQLSSGVLAYFIAAGVKLGTAVEGARVPASAGAGGSAVR